MLHGECHFTDTSVLRGYENVDCTWRTAIAKLQQLLTATFSWWLAVKKVLFVWATSMIGSNGKLHPISCHDGTEGE